MVLVWPFHEGGKNSLGATLRVESQDALRRLGVIWMVGGTWDGLGIRNVEGLKIVEPLQKPLLDFVVEKIHGIDRHLFVGDRSWVVDDYSYVDIVLLQRLWIGFHLSYFGFLIARNLSFSGLFQQFSDGFCGVLSYCAEEGS